jgi:hypothetical protein
MAKYPTEVVEVDRVVDLLHVSHVPGRIAEYREAMERGARFPPISVVRLGRWFVIADGHKRFSAYAASPVPTVLVEVWPLHRWLRDQWQQLVRKTMQIGNVAVRSLYDPRARTVAVRLCRDTIGHWRRIVLSLASAGRETRT